MGHQFEHMYNMYFMIANQFVKKNLCVSGLLFFQFEFFFKLYRDPFFHWLFPVTPPSRGSSLAIPLPHASSPAIPLFPMPQAHASSPAHSQAHASSPCQAHASSPAHPQAHASSPCQAPASSPCLKPIYFPLFPFILIGFQVGSRLVPGWAAAATATTHDHGLPGQVPSPHAPRSEISRSGVPLTPTIPPTLLETGVTEFSDVLSISGFHRGVRGQKPIP